MRGVCRKSRRSSYVRSLCGHCGEYLSKSQYAKHKRKYFNVSSQMWDSSLVASASFSVPDPFESAYSSEDENMAERSMEGQECEDTEECQGKSIRKEEDKNTKDVAEDPDEDPEFWDDLPDEILKDIGNNQPLPEREPQGNSSISKKLTSLLQWFVLFMLLWQANCKVSDNGLEWLLRFLFQLLHFIGITCQCEYLITFCTMFPTSLYVLRQVVQLDRDDFVKYVVCPSCSSLYDPGDCTQCIGGNIVVKCCTNKAFKKGKGAKECGSKLAKKVVLSSGKECFYPFKVYCFNSITTSPRFKCVIGKRVRLLYFLPEGAILFLWVFSSFQFVKCSRLTEVASNKFGFALFRKGEILVRKPLKPTEKTTTKQ